MKLQLLLEEAIYNHLSSKKYEPTLIVVNPATWRELILELAMISNIPPAATAGTAGAYRGVKLIRSYDVEENKFEIA